MIRLFNEKVERKINVKVWSKITKYKKELLILYYSFYNWREKVKVKTTTEEILKELGIL